MNRRVLRNFDDCAKAGGRDTAAKKYDFIFLLRGTSRPNCPAQLINYFIITVGHTCAKSLIVRHTCANLAKAARPAGTSGG